MITDSAIKQKFIVNKLRDAAVFAFRLQSGRANSILKRRSGDTFSALGSPDYTITSSGEKFILTANVTKQLRFQDLGFRKLYTKPLFSSLKHAYGQLRYGLQDDIKDQIREELETALIPK